MQKVYWREISPRLWGSQEWQWGRLIHNVAATEALANSRGALHLGCQAYCSQSLTVSSTSGGHVTFVEAGPSAATGSSQ